ncbi:MAG TPA: hypothetical protein VGN86_02355 [Pyrinomonadaceae bacterium]|nr:hypothetical protein [Pyrinomonadaceae bacterium]
MGFRYGLVLAALLIIAGLTPTGSNGVGRAGQERRAPTENDALAVVQSYFELAGKPDLKEIVNITTPIPKGALKKLEASATPEPEPPPGTAIVTATGLTKDGSLDRIRARFPKSIAESKQQIVQVYRTTIEGSFAKIWIVVGTEKKVQALPWVFMLTKEPAGNWKIYDIQSPADAVDYLPTETQEP